MKRLPELMKNWVIFQSNAANLGIAKYSYLSSLEYGKSTAVNNKITGIDNIAIKKEEQIKSKKR
ncbi:MAG: hypothetical protein IPG09_09970 [Ignavibacteria bacterium]|nr:hypothetical protein [Ignavibacteria bacterium]